MKFRIYGKEKNPFFSFRCIEGRDEIIFPQIIPCDEFKRMKTVTQPLTEEGVEGGVVISSHTWF